MLSELIDLEKPLFAQINALHVGDILDRRPADSARNNHRISLKNDAIIHNFVDTERSKIIVLDEGALVNGVSDLSQHMIPNRECADLLQKDIQTVSQSQDDVV